MGAKGDKRPAGDLGANELARRCPTCKGRVTRADEARGHCRHCGAVLLSLAKSKSRGRGVK